MTFRNFIKPSVSKIILTIVIVIGHIFLMSGGLHCGWSATSMNLPQCKFFLLPIASFIFAPSRLIRTILGIRFNPIEKNANPGGSIIVQILWSYILACLIVWVINKIKYFSKGNKRLQKNIVSE